MWENYYKNGNLRLRGNYKDDLLHGMLKVFYENGQLMEEGTLKMENRKVFVKGIMKMDN